MPLAALRQTVHDLVQQAFGRSSTRRRRGATMCVDSTETLEVRRVMSATTAEDPRTNNTLGTATNLGEVRNDRRGVNGSVGSATDPVDFYRFQAQTNGLALTGRVSTVVEVSGANRNLDLFVYDGSGREIARSTRGGNAFESLSLSLAQGSTYFVKVVPIGSGRSTTYHLDVSTEGGNDTLTQATNLGTVRATTRSMNGSIGTGGDPVDYYKFSPNINGFALTGKIPVTIELSGMSRDLDIIVLDSNGQEVGRGVRGGTASERLTLSLSQGSQYFIKVVPGTSGNQLSNYRLTVRT
jgi:hypothetical protein